jgi:hypothetical protein
MPTKNAAATNESLDAITDALLTASRLLVAISAHSIGQVDETITIPQFRTLVILSNRGPMNLATLAGLLGVQPSASGRMVDRLVGAGLDRPATASDLATRTAGRAHEPRTPSGATGHRAPAHRNRPHRGKDATGETSRAGTRADRMHRRRRRARRKPRGHRHLAEMPTGQETLRHECRPIGVRS